MEQTEKYTFEQVRAYDKLVSVWYYLMVQAIRTNDELYTPAEQVLLNLRQKFVCEHSIYNDEAYNIAQDKYGDVRG